MPRGAGGIIISSSSSTIMMMMVIIIINIKNKVMFLAVSSSHQQPL
jgi:hypothetical protein